MRPLDDRCGRSLSFRLLPSHCQSESKRTVFLRHLRVRFVLRGLNVLFDKLGE